MDLYAGTYIQIHAPLPEKNIYFNHFPFPLGCLSLRIFKNRVYLSIRTIYILFILKNFRIDGCTGVITRYPYTDAFTVYI